MDNLSGVEGVQFFVSWGTSGWQFIGSDVDGSDGWQLMWNANIVPNTTPFAISIALKDRAGNNISTSVVNILLQ